MLCGELARPCMLSNFQSSDGLRSPYSTLLALYCSAMMGPLEEEDVFMENGLMSFENPNYHLDPARLDDALNSNVDDEDPLFREIIRELESRCNITNANKTRYTTGGYSDTLDSLGIDNRHLKRHGSVDNVNVTAMGRRPLDLTSGIRTTKPDLIENTTDLKSSQRSTYYEKPNPPRTLSLTEKTSSGPPDLKTSSIPHVPGDLNNDLYAIPVKLRSSPPPPPTLDLSPSLSSNLSSVENELPSGWERHEDNDGPYYWHIKSGTIQRDPPEFTYGKNEPKTPLVKDAETVLTNFQLTGSNSSNNVLSMVTRSNTSSALEDLDGKRKEEMAFKRRSYPARVESEVKDKLIRFAVRSLGWVEISEHDLTPERSSKAVNKCIVDLSLGRNDLMDNVGRWGDGKDLFMDLDEGALKLTDPENLTVLNTQPIHTIRVWGVGRDNGRERDFAYVARDRSTRRHMCHVFRCDMPARTIANTLRDICKKIMIERSLQQNLAKPLVEMGGNGVGRGGSGGAVRPTNLPTERRLAHRNSTHLVTQSFPTPMEEPKKILRAQYLGSIQVNKPGGMEILNEAINTLVNTVPHHQWQQVNIAVAPSMITIHSTDEETGGSLMAECRVRFLSFLGIGQNIKQCAFIMHTAQDLFIAHAFQAEPSSGALCKTIEAACKLRYQKCLDAHPGGIPRSVQEGGSTPGGSKGLGAALKSIVGSITGRRLRSMTSAES
uniref:Protein Fe65 homolog n=1 Tax=Cacopsylla melanoneura TaxID=428564 RepID=A0A8D8LJ95_9HEMI